MNITPRRTKVHGHRKQRQQYGTMAGHGNLSREAN